MGREGEVQQLVPLHDIAKSLSFARYDYRFEFGQGFLMARPMAIENISKFEQVSLSHPAGG